MKLRTFGTLVAGLLFVAGCASTGGSAVSQSGQAAHRNPDVISQDELDQVVSTGISNAYDAVRRLRPGFLVSRGQVSINNPTAGEITVYVNNQRMGGVAALRDVQILNVKEIRHLNAGEATQRFGTDNAGGAIVVTLK